MSKTGAIMTQAKLNWIVLGMAVVGLGFAMPSCPGQDAMQQQINSLQSANQELTKKVQTLSTQVTAISGEVNQMKQYMVQSTNVFAAQEALNAQLKKSIEEMSKKGGKRR
jgi:peptidoglycan hydrolase CwlO-like protein